MLVIGGLPESRIICVFILRTLLLKKCLVGAGIIIVSKNRSPYLSSVYVMVRKTLCSTILNKYKLQQ